MPKWQYLFPNILQRSIWIPTRILIRLLLKLRVRGLENLTAINLAYFSRSTNQRA